MAQASRLARAASGYASPVGPGTQIMRQDHGQDYQGQPGQYVYAIGPGKVDAVKADPGGFGNALYYTLANGQQIYVGHAQPTVQPGQPLTPGMPVAQLLQHGGGDASNLAGWSEIGLASGGAPTYPKEGGVGGVKFDAFLQSLGIPLVAGGKAQPAAAQYSAPGVGGQPFQPNTLAAAASQPAAPNLARVNAARLQALALQLLRS